MFTGDKTRLDNTATIDEMLKSIGLDSGAIRFCISDPQTINAVEKQLSETQKTNFYGTPTIFIKGKALVSPKPYRVYAINLKRLLYWLK